MGSREDFLASRKTGIGGSDVATILGVNPWQTALELYLEKRSEIEPKPDTEHTRAGRALESVIAHMYAERTGRRLRRCNQMQRHPKHEWLFAHVDREVVGSRVIVEIKNVNPHMQRYWGAEASDAAPDYVIPQPHTYMLIRDYPCADVAAFFGGSHLRVYTIERDREWDEMIVEATHTFWYDNVMAGVPPPFDPEHPAALDALTRIYPGTSGTEIHAPPALLPWHQVRLEALDTRLEMERVIDACDARIRKHMADAAIMYLGSAGRYERKLVKRRGYSVEPTEYMSCKFIKAKENNNA